MSAESFNVRASEIVHRAQQDGNELLREGRLKDAKIAVANAQRDLRAVKRDAMDEQRTVQDSYSYSDARMRANETGQTIGMFAGAKFRSSMARSRAAAKRNIQREQTAAVRPYTELKSHIDRLISELDRNKAQITQAIAEQRDT